MSPVARQRGHAGTAIALAAAGVAVAVAAAFGLSVLASRGDVEVRLGDDVFEAGDAERIADEIDDRGPITYSDVAGGDRDIVLQHLGDDPVTGWYAFDARPAGAGRDCSLAWQAARDRFVDRCSGRSYPPDGGGDLATYPVRVVDGDLEVDLRGDR